MGQPRSLGVTIRQRLTEAEVEFDRDALEQSEAECINVSPFMARFEIATVPGSKPRRYKLEPGQRVHLQYGYTVEGKGAGRDPVRPTIEALTEREAWPGERVENGEGKLEWRQKPGPRLPMVCSVDRARELADGRPGWADQWREAMAKREESTSAPLRMTVRRSDGSPVDVALDLEDVPLRHKPGAREDVEDMTSTAHDEPPPAHDEPLDPVTLPPAEPPPVAAEPRAARQGRPGKGV